MNISNCIHSFQFDDHCLFNDDVQAMLPNDLIFVVDVDLLFCLCEKTTEVQFVEQGPVVDRFNETGPEKFVDFESGADDPAGEFHGRQLRE